MHTKKGKSPVIGKKLLSLLINYNHPESMMADYDEMFDTVEKEKGRLYAIAWFCLQIVFVIPKFVNNSIYWSIIMFNNYLMIALRNIKKHKGYSYINVFGLAVGMACVILIFLYLHHEFNFDRYHQDVDRIFCVVLNSKSIHIIYNR